jgi:hypothetical protein
MKLFIFLTAIFLLTISADKCGSKKSEDTVFKAKLEIKAMCMNYTIRLLEGNIDTSLISATWTMENSDKSYKNVFGLANPCDFPATIKEGDEFYFKLDSLPKSDCAVCMAYYPTPPKKLSIKLVEK